MTDLFAVGHRRNHAPFLDEEPTHQATVLQAFSLVVFDYLTTFTISPDHTDHTSRALIDFVIQG